MFSNFFHLVLRPCLRVRIFLFAVLSTVLQQNDNFIYSLHNKSSNDSNFKAKFAKKVNLNSRFQDNVKFMQTLITCVFLSLLWIYFLILLSGDVHINPGPDSVSLDYSTSNSNNIASYFNQNLSIMHSKYSKLTSKNWTS